MIPKDEIGKERGYLPKWQDLIDIQIDPIVINRSAQKEEHPTDRMMKNRQEMDPENLRWFGIPIMAEKRVH